MNLAFSKFDLDWWIHKPSLTSIYICLFYQVSTPEWCRLFESFIVQKIYDYLCGEMQKCCALSRRPVTNETLAPCNRRPTILNETHAPYTQTVNHLTMKPMLLAHRRPNILRTEPPDLWLTSCIGDKMSAIDLEAKCVWHWLLWCFIMLFVSWNRRIVVNVQANSLKWQGCLQNSYNKRSQSKRQPEGMETQVCVCIAYATDEFGMNNYILQRVLQI